METETVTYTEEDRLWSELIGIAARFGLGVVDWGMTDEDQYHQWAYSPGGTGIEVVPRSPGFTEASRVQAETLERLMKALDGEYRRHTGEPEWGVPFQTGDPTGFTAYSCSGRVSFPFEDLAQMVEGFRGWAVAEWEAGRRIVP